jgi:hypothetical protein
MLGKEVIERLSTEEFVVIEKVSRGINKEGMNEAAFK